MQAIGDNDGGYYYCCKCRCSNCDVSHFLVLFNVFGGMDGCNKYYYLGSSKEFIGLLRRITLSGLCALEVFLHRMGIVAEFFGCNALRSHIFY